MNLTTEPQSEQFDQRQVRIASWRRSRPDVTIDKYYF